jgi:hypothetical protein
MRTAAKSDERLPFTSRQSIQGGTIKPEKKARFSTRHGFLRKDEEPLIYHDAPEQVRVGLLSIVHDDLKRSPSQLRDLVCGVLRVRPNSTNWSEYPNIWDEVQQLVHKAEWFRFYDIVEAFVKEYQRSGEAKNFESAINALFDEERIGWRLQKGGLELHGDESLEEVLGNVKEELKKSGYQVAASELTEARSDLSRRPTPDLSGAIHHAMAALESVAREVGGDRKRTLGEIIKKSPGLFPPPVDEAAAKLWGFASEQARHGKETRELDWEETLLVVGIAGTLCSYLNAKQGGL